jgi:AAA+ ATPase superfamily predicted ATPase
MAYEFPAHTRFLDRSDELTELELWWEDEDYRFPLILQGRRRTGKSWLVREFAHGKEADIFVCDERAEHDQLSSFADDLEGRLGFRPDFPDFRSFCRFLFRQSRDHKRLAVIDEFPLLLGPGRSPADSALAAVMEEELEGSRLKLLLCGSQISTMRELLAERRPLHGRGRSLLLPPLQFSQARVFLAEHADVDLLVRYGLAGGMPLYLLRFARRATVKRIVLEDLLNPLGPLFNEPRDVLKMELTNAAVHFSLLRALSGADNLEWDDLVNRSRVDQSTASRNIDRLIDLQIVEAANPMFTHPSSRRRRYRLQDALMRFWFRFVFPYQDDLMAGLDPEEHWRRTIEPGLAAHLAPSYEKVCRAWVRLRFASTTDTVGRWWGLARHDLRRARQRSSEEIDIVGATQGRVTVVGECEWQAGAMNRAVLDDLRAYKLPALAQTGVDVSAAAIVLFSRSGFTADLQAQARQSGVSLIDVPALLQHLPSINSRT